MEQTPNPPLKFPVEVIPETDYPPLPAAASIPSREVAALLRGVGVVPGNTFVFQESTAWCLITALSWPRATWPGSSSPTDPCPGHCLMRKLQSSN